MEDTFAYFLDQLINGLTLGSIYGLIAIGYTMVYGIIGMINFAHGEIFMIGSFLALIAILLFGVTGSWVPLSLISVLLLVMVLSMLLTAVYGWTLERVAYRPLRGSPRLAALITAIGMSIFLQNYVQLLQSARIKPLQPIVIGGIEVLREGDYVVSLSYMQILIVVLMVVLMLIFSQ
ncbi:MAG: branched-chain amino acid ABC transporter permease LivH, partial [Kiloniellales bacterium]|nr:branched-chain amino acid ABC transporter permease LivH [Kiloniellales bacterium]